MSLAVIPDVAQRRSGIQSNTELYLDSGFASFRSRPGMTTFYFALRGLQKASCSASITSRTSLRDSE